MLEFVRCPDFGRCLITREGEKAQLEKEALGGFGEEIEGLHLLVRGSLFDGSTQPLSEACSLLVGTNRHRAKKSEMAVHLQPRHTDQGCRRDTDQEVREMPGNTFCRQVEPGKELFGSLLWSLAVHGSPDD